MKIEDLITKKDLNKCGEELRDHAGNGTSVRIHFRDQNKIEEQVNENAAKCHQIQLPETSIGGEQGSKDVHHGNCGETAHQNSKDLVSFVVSSINQFTKFIGVK